MPIILVLLILSAALSSCQGPPCGEPRKIKLPSSLLKHDSLCLCVPLRQLMIREPGLNLVTSIEEDHNYVIDLDSSASPQFKWVWYDHRNGFYDHISLFARESAIEWNRVQTIVDALNREYGPPSKEYGGFIEGQPRYKATGGIKATGSLVWEHGDSITIQFDVGKRIGDGYNVYLGIGAGYGG